MIPLRAETRPSRVNISRERLKSSLRAFFQHSEPNLSHFVQATFDVLYETQIAHNSGKVSDAEAGESIGSHAQLEYLLDLLEHLLYHFEESLCFGVLVIEQVFGHVSFIFFFLLKCRFFLIFIWDTGWSRLWDQIVIRVLHFWKVYKTKEGKLFIVMHYFDGGDLLTELLAPLLNLALQIIIKFLLLFMLSGLRE